MIKSTDLFSDGNDAGVRHEVVGNRSSLKHSPTADQAIPGKGSPVTPSVSQSDVYVGARLTRGILYGLPISTLFWLLIALTFAS